MIQEPHEPETPGLIANVNHAAIVVVGCGIADGFSPQTGRGFLRIEWLRLRNSNRMTAGRGRAHMYMWLVSKQASRYKTTCKLNYS